MNERAKISLETEITILKRLNHKNIVSLQCHYVENDRIYIVMEFCKKGDLKVAIQTQKDSGVPFSEKQLLSWILDLLEAAAYLHQHHIIHRDIKPGNILLSATFSLKLTDFGVSRILGMNILYTFVLNNNIQLCFDCVDFTSELVDTVIGTRIYMAPEVMLEDGYDNRSDTWSIGVCTYEMVSFEHPFPKAGNVANVNFKYKPLRSQSCLISFIKQMLNRNKIDRSRAADLLKKVNLKRMELQSVSVFRFRERGFGWTYKGSPDEITFNVDKEIFVLGFGLFGSECSKYNVIIDLYLSNDYNSENLLGSNNTFTFKGANSQVMFKEPIKIQPFTNYTASCKIQGPSSLVGQMGQSRVTIDCPNGNKVTFQFSDSVRNNGTCVEKGQIPEIIFYA